MKNIKKNAEILRCYIKLIDTYPMSQNLQYVLYLCFCRCGDIL